MTRTLILAAIAIVLSACVVKAQDSYVPVGLKSSCEWWSGETCVRRRDRVRPRIVVVPKTTYTPYRVVPEHLVPLHKREAEVRGWRREWDLRDRDRHLRERERFSHLRAGARCWPVKIKAYSDEKVARDGKTEAIRRWSGMVRSELGELFMDFKNSVDRSELCWQSSTGERLTDKMTGGNERCMVEARPCRAEKIKEADDE